MFGVFHGLNRRHSQSLGAGLEKGDGVETDGFVDDHPFFGVAADDGAAPVARSLDGALNFLQIPFVGDFVAVSPSHRDGPVLKRGEGGEEGKGRTEENCVSGGFEQYVKIQLNLSKIRVTFKHL